MLPYGHQQIDDDDVRAVVEVLRSDWLTTGPKVEEFEEAFAAYARANHAVSFSSGTAALHGAAFAANLGPGEEAITTPLTFCATANCILYQGAQPVFADVQEDTLTIDPARIKERITSRTRAMIPVDYAGHPAELDEILALAEQHRLVVIEDACHSLGAEYKSRRVGSLAHMTVFSFHPVKHMTTGEGGMVTTDDPQFARRLRIFRNHGIDSDARKRSLQGQWFYEMVALGFNYRLADIGCALGLSQLRKLDRNLARRREIASRYNRILSDLPGVRIPRVLPHANPAWHLYTARFERKVLGATRGEIFAALRGEGLGVNVHYIPVHLHPYYRATFGDRRGAYPVAEKAYEQLISLPIFSGMTDTDVDDVTAAFQKVVEHYLGAASYGSKHG